MATILKAGNVASGAQITSDATGILEIRTGTGAGTTAITVGTNQAVTMAGAVSSSSLTVNSNNISAVNSLGFRNRIINGAMVIDQRNSGASVTPANDAYTLDRWQAKQSTASKFSVQQNAGSVTPPAGYTKYLGCTSLSSFSVGSSDIFGVRQCIEGFNVADLGWGTANAQAVTVGFWVRSSLTGTFAGSLFNYTGARSYPFSYTISASNTWEYKTVTVAGDTTGTWETGNSGGLFVFFSLGTGSSLSGTAGAWAGTYTPSVTGATSVVGTNGATFYITGVQLEAGSVATPFERRDYGRELMMAQRYYAKQTAGTGAYTGFGAGTFGGASQGNIFIQYPTSMRSSPTFSQSNCAVSDGPANIAVSSITNFFGGSNSGLAVLALASAGTQYRGAALVANNNTSAYVDFSAEL